MKIAIIGYGKMGHMIEEAAKRRGHEVVSIIDKDNHSDFDSEAFRSADCAIEFSTPDTAVDNILNAFRQGVSVVCGTTGWTSRMPEIEEACRKARTGFLWSSNYSVGVNIFMAVNRYLASIMDKFPEYTPHMVETHHIHKLDHPSGTAITLAEEIENAVSRVGGWQEPGADGKSMRNPLKPDAPLMELDHIRSGEVPGIHTIVWDSDVDSIMITHSAKSRAGFALGAVMAAEWLAGRTGVHTIGEVFRF